MPLPLRRERQAAVQVRGGGGRHRSEWRRRRDAVELGIEITHAAVEPEFGRRRVVDLDFAAIDRGYARVEQQRHYTQAVGNLDVVVVRREGGDIQAQVVARIELESQLDGFGRFRLERDRRIARRRGVVALVESTALE